jgi:GTP-binding protein HflX
MTRHVLPAPEGPERVVLAALASPATRRGDGLAPDDESRLDELRALAVSAGGEVVGAVFQRRGAPDPGTFLGKGKLEDLKREVEVGGAELVVFDNDLSPAQGKKLEDALGVRVLDRSELILDIFADRARTREAKLQVELAQLQYLLPRLRRMWTHLSRIRGGIGLRGPGETQLEVDRRRILTRTRKLERDLAQLAKTRATQRKARRRRELPTLALVGYTNAGKSTLLNRLTGASAVVADQLFATLDPTVRRLELPGGRDVTLSDTVGFVSKLPHDLVEAYRSTLEEVALADVIMHVADASSGAIDAQIDAVHRVLEEIGAGEIPQVLVLNKIDQVAGSDRARLARHLPGSVAVSALTGEGAEELLMAVAEAIPHPALEVTLLVPWGREDVTARLYREAEVLGTETDGEGTIVRALVDARGLAAVQEFVRS